MKWSDLDWFKSGASENMEKKILAIPRQKTQPHQFYKAMDLTPFDKVKVVILGQDPYPTPGMATGLAFSVPKHQKTLPPTLYNIFLEYCSDLHYPTPKT